MSNRTKLGLLCGALILAACGENVALAGPRQLPPEQIPAVRELPSVIPQDWAMVHDVSAGAISEGRIVFVDMGDKAEVRAQVGAGFLANYQFVPARRALYVAETFYSRSTRGTRSDVITVYDTKTMKPIDEIALPGGKRGIFVPDAGAFQLINEDKWGLVFNFTPGASVTVVDLVSRKILSEVEIPGCAMVYPLAGRNFATLCGDGTMLSIALDEHGKLVSTQSTAAFNDIDNDPMFMRPAVAGSTTWFVTFRGKLQPVDTSGQVAHAGSAFLIPKQSGGAPEWRPGGMQILAADAHGRLYVLMNPNGSDGTHKDGGSEVWLLDPREHAIVRRIPLAARSISIAATHESQPKLAVLGIDRTLRVYDPESGTLLRSIPAVGLSPFSLAVVP